MMDVSETNLIGMKEGGTSCVENLRGNEFSTKNFIVFKLLETLYEKPVSEKGSQGEKAVPISYNAAIEVFDFVIFLASVWIKVVSIEFIFENKNKTCISCR